MHEEKHRGVRVAFLLWVNPRAHHSSRRMDTVKLCLERVDIHPSSTHVLYRIEASKAFGQMQCMS